MYKLEKLEIHIHNARLRLCFFRFLSFEKDETGGKIELKKKGARLEFIAPIQKKREFQRNICTNL